MLTLFVIFCSWFFCNFSTSEKTASRSMYCSWSVGSCSLFLSRSASNSSRDVSSDTNLAVSSVYANTPAATSKISDATVFIGICTEASSDMFNVFLLIFWFWWRQYIIFRRHFQCTVIHALRIWISFDIIIF